MRSTFAKVVLVCLALYALPTSEANAKTIRISGTGSSTSVQVPVDLDGNSGADSGLSTTAGVGSGGPETGPFTGQAVAEVVPAPGTGCVYAPLSIQACTIGAVTDGCLFQYVGGDGVDRFGATGDLEIFKLASGSLCINFDTPLPWNFSGQQQWNIVGGTGKVANATGSFTVNLQGQILQNDAQGHGLAWSTYSSSGTLSVP